MDTMAGKIENQTIDQAPIKITSKSYAIGIYLFVVKDGIAYIDGIHRDSFLKLINEQGFLKRYQNDTYQYIFENENIIEPVGIPQIRDAINSIVQKSKDLKIEFQGLTFVATAEKQIETFLRNSPSLFNDAILGHLPNHTLPILHDTKTEMFFPFNNCVISVTSNEVKQLYYSEIKEICIWKEHIIKREVDLLNESDAQFAKFIKNVSTNTDKNDFDPDRENAFHSAIGYMLHNYSDPTTSRIVIAYDEQLSGTREPVGGTGKGIVFQSFKELRSVAIIDGKKIKDDNQFSYQVVTPRTQIIVFDDVKPNFDFLTLNSNSTAGWQIEQKRKAIFRFAPFENPKTYITSNTIIKGEGTTITRRQFILEFSPYYSKLVQQNIEPIIHVHGGMFFSSDWDQIEWNKFFSFMFICCQYYLINGLQFYSLRSVHQNKLMQSTSDDFTEWISFANLSTQEEFNLTEKFNDFKGQYYGEDNDFKQRIFTNYLKMYALTNNWELKTRRSNHETIGKFIKK